MALSEFAPDVIGLGHDLFSIKLYWVAISTLWTYEYFLTLPDEIKYGWRGKKTAVFWLFILNRYLMPCFLVITLVAYFANAWSLDVCVVYNCCQRYGFMETFETMLTTWIAEIFLTLRVYALMKKNKIVLLISGLILLLQSGIAIFAMSQSSQGTDQVALLLPVPRFPLPTLPDTDPYHVCIFISVLTLVPWVEAYLCLGLAFDALAFLAILYVTFEANRKHGVIPLIQVIQRDGVLYFFVLFSSNLVWVLLLLYARPALKFLHNQPAMVVSTIMINRITLNLKRARDEDSPWALQTFEALPGSVSEGSHGVRNKSFRSGRDGIELNNVRVGKTEV